MRYRTIAALVIVAGLLAVTATQAVAKRTVPSGLVNKPLNVVEKKLDAKGIGFKTRGGGIFGIIIKGDWGVCATIPAAGKAIHGPITLVVAHFTCGVR